MSPVILGIALVGIPWVIMQIVLLVRHYIRGPSDLYFVLIPPLAKDTFLTRVKVSHVGRSIPRGWSIRQNIAMPLTDALAEARQLNDTISVVIYVPSMRECTSRDCCMWWWRAPRLEMRKFGVMELTLDAASAQRLVTYYNTGLRNGTMTHPTIA